MDGLIEFNGKTYYLDLDKIIEFCLKSETKNVRDSEITEGYEKIDEENNSLTLTSRVIRESTGFSNPQNDMITYDIIKMLLSVVFSDSFTLETTVLLNNIIVFNTMLKMGFLNEI